MPRWYPVLFIALAGCGTSSFPASSVSDPGPELKRTWVLDHVLGEVDGTGITGRIDHMTYDPVTGRMFVACVANGTVEVIDLESGQHVGSIQGLKKPQGVRVTRGLLLVTTGEDGLLHQFDSQTLTAKKSVPVGDDADNIRIAQNSTAWVSFGGDRPGFAAFDPVTLIPVKKLSTTRMPEGFQLQPSGSILYANMPAGKRSPGSGSVFALQLPDGKALWERPLVDRVGNFPMVLDASRDRLFVVTRHPARLICLHSTDGAILSELPCVQESDDLVFDEVSGFIAVVGGGSPKTATEPGGSGAALELFRLSNSDELSRHSQTPLPPHSRTATLAEARHAIYVACPALTDRPAEVREYLLPKH